MLLSIFRVEVQEIRASIDVALAVYEAAKLAA